VRREFNIDDDRFAGMTTDTVSVNHALAAHVAASFRNERGGGRHFIHHLCFPHQLNLVVVAALKELGAGDWQDELKVPSMCLN